MPTPSIEERFRKAAHRSALRSLKASSSFRSVVPILHDDVPTFIEAPHDADRADSDVVVFGFPYEGIRARDTRTMIEPDAGRESRWQTRPQQSQVLGQPMTMGSAGIAAATAKRDELVEATH